MSQWPPYQVSNQVAGLAWPGHHAVYITTSPGTPGPNMAMGPIAVLALLHTPQSPDPRSLVCRFVCMLHSAVLQCCGHRREMLVVDCTLQSCCMSWTWGLQLPVCATAVCGEWSWSVASCHCTLGTADSSRVCEKFFALLLSWIARVLGRWSCLNQIPVCSGQL